MKHVLMSILFVLSGVAALAQQPPPNPRGFGRPLGPPPSGRGGPGGIEILGVEPMELPEPIAGVPFFAEAVTDVVQQLTDGNRIERRSVSTLARDGRGRVRQEQQLAALGPALPAPDVRIVTISNAALGEHYFLDAGRRVAVRSRLPRSPGTGPGSLSPDSTKRPPPPEGLPRPEVRSEKLGTQRIEGVRADGTRTIVTIPAGAVGNQRPIQIVSERWFSSELQIVVLSKRNDPRFGDVTYRLTRLVRSEPARELFEVPPDYTVEDGPPRRR